MFACLGVRFKLPLWDGVVDSCRVMSKAVVDEFS